ncbi:hypothetical protein B0H34DRAFT_297921 [Crassisporium funariophilum]|nr:hypothetical protein B0H34DRAFT_297921 [Crassisporium funariophilum]
MTTQSTTTSCCSCLAPYFFESRRRSLWDVDPLHNRNTLQDPGVGDFFPIPRAMKHLALLFDFLLDPRRAGEYVMTSEKYARAAHRCLERLSLPFAQHTSIGIGVASRHSGLTYIEGACLECAAVLLSRAAITEELVSFVTDYKIRPVGGASLKIETLTVEIERYRQVGIQVSSMKVAVDNTYSARRMHSRLRYILWTVSNIAEPFLLIARCLSCRCILTRTSRVLSILPQSDCEAFAWPHVPAPESSVS